MKNSYKTAVYLTFFLLFLAAPMAAAEEPETGFSCMKEQVRPIIRVTDEHQEYDVVVRNQCPGSVYWAMCIERLDPWRFNVLETHQPVGFVEAEKRSRVNLHMKATPGPAGEVDRAQAFYMSVAYSINGPATATCVAKSCEAKKKDLRAAVLKNESAWRQARMALQQKAETECPDNGWNQSDTETCRQAIYDAAAEKMAAYEAGNEDLKEKLAAIDPDTCTVFGGDSLELDKS
jgi:hypothetical protein